MNAPKINRLTGVVIPDENRGTGRTTALALHYLSAAIESPNRVVVVRDHYDSRAADELLLERMIEMATKLGLRNLTFNRSELYVRFDLWEPV